MEAASTSTDELRAKFAQLGLPIDDEGLRIILAGDARNRAMRARLRELVGALDEPAGVFAAQQAFRQESQR